MSISLFGSAQSLFNRWGTFLFSILSRDRINGDTAITSASPDVNAIGTSFTEIFAGYTTLDLEIIDALASQITSVRTSDSAWKSYAAARVEAIAIAMAHRDVTLVTKDKITAIKEIITQMVGSGTLYNADNDIDASTVSITTAALSSNTGNAVLVGAVVRPDARNNELIFNEVLEVQCTSDYQTGGTARSESWTVKGEPAVSALAYDWPRGSGANTTLTTVDASLDNSGNILTNSDFESWGGVPTSSANVPDRFAVLAGTVGTTVLKETSTIYGTHGAASLRFVGDAGGTLTSLAQSFNDSTNGTAYKLLPNTVYLVNFYARKSASLLAGEIQCRLLDSSNAVISNDAGTNLSFSVAHGTLTTSFASYTGIFVTPKNLSSTTYKLNLRVSVALTNGESVYFDDLAIAVGKVAYPNGLYLAMFAGSINPIIGDKYTGTASNNYAGLFQQQLDRVLGMREMGLQFPSDAAGAETIADTLLG